MNGLGNAIRRNRLILAVITTLVLTAPGLVNADSEKISLAIKSQKMGSALMELSAQTGVHIMLPQSAGDAAQFAGIQGEYTLRAALDEMLAGSGLVYEFVSDDSVLIKEGVKDTRREPSMEKKSLVEEVIVTAEKRAENVQDIPIAISALSGETIQNAGVTGIKDLKIVAPSVQFGQHNGPQNFVSIRGIGTVLRNIGAESGVTISQDGVPFMQTLMFDADFFDVERVEVLRGPQGTISGRNATGGAINIYSKRPTAEFESGLQFTVGNYNRFETEGYVSGPIAGEGLLGRLAVRTQRSDGWLENTQLNERFFGADLVQAKGSLVASLTDDIEAHLILEGMIDKEKRATGVELGRGRPDWPSLSELHGVAGFDPEGLTFAANFPQAWKAESYKATLKVSWELSSTASLTSTTSYISYEVPNATLDFDGTLVPWSNFPFFHLDIWQASQEFTLTADLSDRLDAIMGFLYLRNGAEEPLALGLPLLGLPNGSLELRPDQDTTSYALYSQWRYRFTDALRLTLGARYTYDKKDVVEEDIVFGGSALLQDSQSWGAFTPRLALDYAPSDNMTLYASISRGFKAGGFNAYGAVGGLPNGFEPEFVWNYEMGVKANGFDQRLRAALTAFYMDYKNLQNDVFIVPEGGVTPVTVVRNASTASIKGAELELNLQVSDEFTLSATGTWLDAVYEELRSEDPFYSSLGELDLAGNRLPRTPEFQFTVSAEYVVPIGGNLQAVLRTDYQWQDKVFFDFYNRPVNVQEAYGLLNLYGALETLDGRWKVSAFARNVFDKRYIAGGELFDTTAALGSFAGIPSAQVFGQIGEPRMYGVSVAYNF